MANDPLNAPADLPEGYSAAPITEGGEKTAIRLCAVVKKAPDPAAGQLVAVRETVEATAYLGAVTDAAGKVHQWVEVWVQKPAEAIHAPASARENLTPKVLEARWQKKAEMFRALDPAGSITTGWESTLPGPIAFDAGTLKRVASDGDGAKGGTIALNPSGSLMLVRAFSPLTFDQFADILGGAAYEGLRHGRGTLNIGMPDSADDAESSPLNEGWIFLGKHGRWGRLIEAFHLKLRLLAQVTALAARAARLSQKPMLNLSAASLRVRLAAEAAGLPQLWTAAPMLVDLGDAFELPIRTTDAVYHVAGSTAASIYKPASAAAPIRGRGALRVRQVLAADAQGMVQLEGTFSTQERIEPARNDLTWISLSLAQGPVDLYARLEQERALAAGEWRFRTIGQRFSPQTLAALKAAEGVPIADAPFEQIPLLSTACDLYALAVLAVRSLLVNPQTTLPVALDEMLSLARQANAAQGEEPLAEKIKGLFAGDPRWLDSLGPHRLTQDALTPQEAFDLVPQQAWFEALAMVVRMLPGLGPQSRCRDLGDAPAGAAQKVFDGALADMQSLLVKTRSLIVIDWKFNREIHAVIRAQSVLAQ